MGVSATAWSCPVWHSASASGAEDRGSTVDTGFGVTFGRGRTLAGERLLIPKALFCAASARGGVTAAELCVRGGTAVPPSCVGVQNRLGCCPPGLGDLAGIACTGEGAGDCDRSSKRYCPPGLGDLAAFACTGQGAGDGGRSSKRYVGVAALMTIAAACASGGCNSREIWSAGEVAYPTLIRFGETPPHLKVKGAVVVDILVLYTTLVGLTSRDVAGCL
mmetsp:Transcript_98257/g.225544  ORF Transcript_98257/g.225544 Transcript_98257/m.225544 type:complete len:219 (-) Transcript_98257:236-892(-)